MNLYNLFEDDNRTPNPNYAEELAYQIFKAAPNLDTTGAADEVLDYAYDLVVNDFGKTKANALFAYDKDFDSDLVNAYLDLQMNQQAADKKQVNEVDPRNFDSDEDYYAALNAPAKRRSAPSDYPYSPEEDDAYFREIFRKKREAAKKAEQDKDQGVAEGQLNEYLVQAGMPVKDVLALNLFQDTSPDGQEGMADDPRWRRLMKKYQPIANMLAKQIIALGKNRRLSDAEAEAVEEVWYDGSDAYDDMEIEYLADYYDMQIATVEAIIAGELQDEMDEGVAESRMSELDAEYEDYKKLSPREFFNMYRITKQAWLAKYKSMLPVSEADAQVNGQDVDVGVVVSKLKKFVVNAEQQLQNADYDQQRQYATTVRDRAVKALNMIKQGGNTPEAAGAAFKYMQTGKQGVAEADKKKEDELEPQIKDVALQRAISRAKADFPTAGSGIEALSKDFMRSQDQDQKSFDQLRQAERKQDQMLGQIAKIDQEQEQEIKGLENQNSTLASRLQQLQNVNGELEKKLAAMSGRKSEKKSKTDTAITPAVAPTASSPELIKPATKKAAKTKSAAPKSSMKSTAAQLAAPKADPMAAMTHRIQKGDASIINPKQRSLDFEPTDNVLGPVVPQQQQLDPRFADARANATDVEPKYYADIAKRVASSPEEFKAAMSGVRENDDQEADYSDKYQDMVARVGQKAREQEKSKPVDIKDLARRLAAIEASRKD